MRIADSTLFNPSPSSFNQPFPRLSLNNHSPLQHKSAFISKRTGDHRHHRGSPRLRGQSRRTLSPGLMEGHRKTRRPSRSEPANPSKTTIIQPRSHGRERKKRQFGKDYGTVIHSQTIARDNLERTKNRRPKAKRTTNKPQPFKQNNSRTTAEQYLRKPKWR